MSHRKSYGKSSEPIDQWLELQGLYRKHTAHDASCLFRAVAEQHFSTQSYHETVRRQCVQFIQMNRHKYEQKIEGSFENYISRISSLKDWGGHLEMDAMSLLYSRDFLIFQHPGEAPFAATNYGFKETILLCSSSGGHYDSVYSKAYIEDAAFCQSMVYEMLYGKVFQLQDVGFAVDKMLHKTNRSRRDSHGSQSYIGASSREGTNSFLPTKPGWRLESEYEEELDVKVLLSRGITPFPYKVAKALDPDIYRNIEFDIWNDMRREMRLGMQFGFNNGELQVGVKCIVKLQPDRTCYAHIQEMAPNKGPVLVFVEELGSKCTVPFDVLEPLPPSEQTQWALPYHRQRQLAMSAKSSLLALQEFGNKCWKPKTNKQRKSKESLMPVTPPSPMQFQSDQSQQTESENEAFRDSYSVEQHSNSTGYQSYHENVAYTNNSTVHCAPSSPPFSSDDTSHVDSTTPMMETELSQPSYFTPQPIPQLPQQPSYFVFNNMLNAPQPRVNFLAQKSFQMSGSDLPLSDLATLRFFYNLGLDCIRSTCGSPWPNTSPPPPPPSVAPPSENNNVPVLPDSTMPAEDEGHQPQTQQSVANAWQNRPLLQDARAQEMEHNGQLAVVDQPVVAENEPVISSVSSSQVPQMMEPYTSTTIVPYYPMEIESVPYFTMAAPFPYMRPPDVPIPLQPPSMYPPPLAPIMYHQQPPAPLPPFNHWVPPPEVIPQYNVAM